MDKIIKINLDIKIINSTFSLLFLFIKIVPTKDVLIELLRLHCYINKFHLYYSQSLFFMYFGEDGLDFRTLYGLLRIHYEPDINDSFDDWFPEWRVKLFGKTILKQRKPEDV